MKIKFKLLLITLIINLIGITSIRYLTFDYEITDNCYSRATSSWLLRPPIYISSTPILGRHVLSPGTYSFELQSSNDSEVSDYHYFLQYYPKGSKFDFDEINFDQEGKINLSLQEGDKLKIHTMNTTFIPQTASICLN